MLPRWPALGLAGPEAAPIAGPCAHGGGGASRERGGDTGLICITARRARRREAALVPGAGSDFESAAAAAAAAAGQREQRRRPPSTEAGAAVERRCAGTASPSFPPGPPGCARPGSGSALRGTLPRAAAAATRMLRGCSFCTRSAARTHPTSQSGAARRALHGST